MSVSYSRVGDGGVDSNERGRDVGRSVVEIFAGVADGDADKVDSSPISSEYGDKGVVLVRFLL